MKKSGAFALRGVGMIEVLVALLVLAIGVLAYAGLQLSALKGMEEANNRAIATVIAQDALERFLSNEAGMATYRAASSWQGAAITPGEQPVDWKKCSNATCSSTQMASWDIAQLSWLAANSMPGGDIAVSECAYASDLLCVVLSWGKQALGDCMDAGGIAADKDDHCVVLEVSR